jgi:L-threonine-O-3-phosphate decarboxylase
VGCSPGEVLDFSASINPLGPPASALVALNAHLQDLTVYPDPAATELRQALSAFHQVPAHWILPGNGAAELLTWACRDLAQLSAVHLMVPAFGDYRRALAAFDATVRTHPLPIEAITPSLPVPKSGAGLLLNNPHNPTGYLWSRATLMSCLTRYELVVVDEAFMDFLPAEKQQSLLDCVMDYPNLIIVRSLTKFFSLPGLRLGYAIAHPDHLQRWRQWRDPWSVNVLASAAGIAALQDTAFQHQTWAWLPAARSHLFTGLQQLPGLQPLLGAANFLLVASDYSVTALQRALLEADRILIRDCLSFPELGDRYFRVAVRTVAENQRLLDALAVVLPTVPSSPHDRA